MNQPPRVSRRQFLSRGAACATALSFPTVVPARVLGRGGIAPPSERIRVGLIGCGNHGVYWNLPQIFRCPDVQVVAVCDVDRNHLAEGQKAVDDTLRSRSRQGLHALRHVRRLPQADFAQGPRRRLQPHARPLAHHPRDHGGEVRQGRDLREAAHAVSCRGRGALQGDRREQAGLPDRLRESLDRRLHPAGRAGAKRRAGQARSKSRSACPRATTTSGWVRSRSPPSISANPSRSLPSSITTRGWARRQTCPYIPARLHGSFRWNLAFSGGVLTDWGAHMIDLAQWGHDTEHTGPVTRLRQGRLPASRRRLQHRRHV